MRSAFTATRFGYARVLGQRQTGAWLLLACVLFSLSVVAANAQSITGEPGFAQRHHDH